MESSKQDADQLIPRWARPAPNPDQKWSRAAGFILSDLDCSKRFEPAPQEIKKAVQEIHTNITFSIYILVYRPGIQKTVRQSLDQVYIKSLNMDQIFATQGALYYSILQAFCDA